MWLYVLQPPSAKLKASDKYILTSGLAWERGRLKYSHNGRRPPVSRHARRTWIIPQWICRNGVRRYPSAIANVSQYPVFPPYRRLAFDALAQPKSLQRKSCSNETNFRMALRSSHIHAACNRVHRVLRQRHCGRRYARRREIRRRLGRYSFLPERRDTAAQRSIPPPHRPFE